jgi:protein TonB
MFDDVLIESSGKSSSTGTWITALISGVVHLLIVGAIVAAGLYVKENPEVIEKPMSAFIVAAAPPPPPPPPPGGGAPQQRVAVETPREPRREHFIQPSQTPRDVPVVEETGTDQDAVPGGMPGGVPGGRPGGVPGGVSGGVDGGVPGGIPGGQPGGTGTGPLRVGGNVKPPVAVLRVDPIYTEVARRARVQGIVIIEAVIDRQGNVTEAHVLKPLPFGLDAAALQAVKQWKFRPGTLNGQPVPVYYNLTVNFRIE